MEYFILFLTLINPTTESENIANTISLNWGTSQVYLIPPAIYQC